MSLRPVLGNLVRLFKQKLKPGLHLGWEHLPRMCEGLGFIPSTQRNGTQMIHKNTLSSDYHSRCLSASMLAGGWFLLASQLQFKPCARLESSLFNACTVIRHHLPPLLPCSPELAHLRACWPGEALPTLNHSLWVSTFLRSNIIVRNTEREHKFSHVPQTLHWVLCGDDTYYYSLRIEYS